jgi:polygalacturonase
MAVNLSPVGGVAAQFFDNSGNVLTGGLLYSYLAGTTTPAVTYTTASGTTPNSNPVVLDAAGRVPFSGEIWLTDGISYKFVLKDSNDVQIATWDNIVGINSNFIAYTGQSEIATATQSQTVFTLTTIQYQPATNNLAVYINGSKQVVGTNFQETSSTTVTFVDGLNVGDVVEFSTAEAISTTVSSADDVSYIQGGAGSVYRNVTSKLQESVSVKDFGATGDGATDDTTAIQAAVAIGGSIYFPTGTYKITGQITLTSDLEIYGDGASSLIQMADDGFIAFSTGTSGTAKSNIIVRDLQINGGGQNGNINDGYAGNYGVYITAATNVKLDNLTITKMGVVNAAAPQTDLGYSGYGIIAEARHGGLNNIRISNCTVSDIAGGGNDLGDGIYVAGYAAGAGTSYVDVVVSNCWVSNVGRHCYTVAGGSGETTPSGVKFIGCYGEASALCGLDIEEGNNVLVDGCTFKSCGNYQTYYNPAVVFGATYRLLAGVANGASSSYNTISNSTFISCYYGVTEAGSNLTISNSTFETSTISDLIRGLANSATGLHLINSVFNKGVYNTSETFYSTSTQSNFLASGCYFGDTFKVAAMSNGGFENCVFQKGFQVTGAGFNKNKFIGCSFVNWTGIGLQCNANNLSATDVLVNNCVFNGTGNMTYGISLGFNSALRWTISDCKFIGLVNAGIYQSNGNAVHCFDAYNNSFVSCADGILVYQAINASIISGNTFTSISAGCISIFDIASGTAMVNTSIINNVTGTGCVNGVAVLVTTGTFDYCIFIGNNVHSCSGTKWNIQAGQNTNGVLANNITT